MERVRKTFFDPLATLKVRVEELLRDLPVGSAHPFSPEKVLLHKTENGVGEIDISSYPEDFFFNAVDLGEMGEILLRRMAGFKDHLSVFSDFQIMQAPAATFKIPLVSGQITILAVSERTPTYYDFCFADADCNACCWLARNTFPGITHSGDLLCGQDLLDYIRIDSGTLTEKEICVFISGYQSTHITRFLGTHPALLVADHVDKILYIVPVPLDKATIGDATICCPLVVKRAGSSLICSILPTATTDRNMMCCSERLQSPAFPEAIKRADFTITAPAPPAITAAAAEGNPEYLNLVKPEIVAYISSHIPEAISDPAKENNSEHIGKILAKENAVITTSTVTLPSFLDKETYQRIRFGTGLEFKLPDEEMPPATESAVVLPCVFGYKLEGPVLLATGTLPQNVPFTDEKDLLDYYKKLKNVVFIVDERMTDNARNLATSQRMNALFIVQLKPEKESKKSDEILSLMNAANINAVTALAGPQSLVLVQIGDKYYFYRGIANREYLNTTRMTFGSDVTDVVQSVGMEGLIDPRAERFVDLADENTTILLPTSGQLVVPRDLEKLFKDLPTDKINGMEEDISGAVPQLQMLMNQKDLSALSKSLITILEGKVNEAVAPLRERYTTYLTKELNMSDPESVKKKNLMLGELRTVTKKMQKALEPVISAFANMMSAQTTSKRTHDLQRLVRQAKIQSNVEAVKSMTFDTLAGYLEDYAADMGVMLLNIDTTSFETLLGNLKTEAIDAGPCCDLDSRVLHLEGFDAGIIIQQSQNDHRGPLRNQAGPSHPIMALPYLSQQRGTGSMLAWVCWDEFVNLKSPYTVRWMEKCNDAHIAALRIIMRDTLSNAVASREHKINPASPETGNLMAALLMSAMSKLAGMRTTAPTVLETAEDTVTRLMRGLFGNLLTIAGSGVRPLSFVWQLFGLNPTYDIPTNDAGWIWYETVVALYPYTGWPLEQFYENLEKFLDKVIVRVVTKSEDTAVIKSSRIDKMAKECKQRNIQLAHSRTIITIVMRMLTDDNADIPAIAKRLLEQIPERVPGETKSYGKMIKYLQHLANGGERRPYDDYVAASVYNKRSAAYSEIKTKVFDACEASDWSKVKEQCQALIDENNRIATLWKIAPEALKVQNMRTYKGLLGLDFEAEGQSDKITELGKKVRNDAERQRVPWQVGKEGHFGDNIEPLDEAFMLEILTGEAAPEAPAEEESEAAAVTTVATVAPSVEDEFSQYKSALQPAFITTMQRDLSASDVCEVLKVPTSAMRVFVKALNSDFVWEDLPKRFKLVILDLLESRSDRLERRPIKKLLSLGQRGNSRLLN